MECAWKHDAMLRHLCSLCEYLIKFQPIINCYLGEINVTRLASYAKDKIVSSTRAHRFNSKFSPPAWRGTNLGHDCVYPHTLWGRNQLNIDFLDSRVWNKPVKRYRSLIERGQETIIRSLWKNNEQLFNDIHRIWGKGNVSWIRWKRIFRH